MTESRIKQLRNEKGWSQQELAKKLNMNRVNISNYERKVITNIPGEVLISIADLFDVSVDYLLGLVDEPFRGNNFEYTDLEALNFLKQHGHPTFSAIIADSETVEDAIEKANAYLIIHNGEDFTFDYKEASPRSRRIQLERFNLYFKNNHKPAPKINDSMIPLIGSVCAGDGLLAETNIEEYIYFPLPRKQQPDYALRVIGDSMTNAGINDGDIVYLKKTSWADFNGQIVVALFNENEDATLKRMKWTEGSPIIHLIPENESYETINVMPNEIRICGVYMGHFKNMSNEI